MRTSQSPIEHDGNAGLHDIIALILEAGASAVGALVREPDVSP